MPMHMLQNRAFVNAVRKAFNVSAYADDDKFFNFDDAPEPMPEPLQASAEEIPAESIPEPIAEPLPAPEPASILGQVDPSFAASDVSIPELEPKNADARKNGTNSRTGSRFWC
jgi:hypothetical protein